MNHFYLRLAHLHDEMAKIYRQIAEGPAPIPSPPAQPDQRPALIYDTTKKSKKRKRRG